MTVTSDGTLEGTPGSGDSGNKSVVFRVEDSLGDSQILDIPYTINVIPDTTIYVSPDGDDSNPGTYELPFATITYAASIAQPGDQIKLRGGIYNESVHIDNIHGTEDEPITISNYQDENVVIEGAKDITTEWIAYEGNIWKTVVDFDVTQLFLDDAMLIGARWPDIEKHWDEYDESDGDNPTPGSYWDLGTRSHADRIVEESTVSNRFKNQDEGHSLSDLNVSVEGGVIVVNGVGPKVFDITSHTAGEATFEISSGAEDLNSLENYYICLLYTSDAADE